MTRDIFHAFLAECESRGYFHVKGEGMLVETYEFKPKGSQSGRDSQEILCYQRHKKEPVISLRATLAETLMAKNITVILRDTEIRFLNDRVIFLSISLLQFLARRRGSRKKRLSVINVLKRVSSARQKVCNVIMTNVESLRQNV